MNFKEKSIIGAIRCFSLTFFLLSSPLLAEQASESGDMKSILSLSLEDLLDIKVSVASRFEQSIIDTPSNVTIISKKQLRAWNVSSLWHLIARVPGMTPTLDRDQKIISSRGLVDGNTRGVLILVNGVPFYDSNTLASRGIESQPLNLDLLEQVEILRGPGGLSWTGNPLLMVINLKMKAANEQGSEAHIFMGSESSRGGSFITGIENNGWQLNFNASYYKSSGKEIESLSSIKPSNERIRFDADFSNQNPPFGQTSFKLDEYKDSYTLFSEFKMGKFTAQGFYMDVLGNNRQQETGMGRELLEDLSRGFLDLSYDLVIDESAIFNISYTGSKHNMLWRGSQRSEPTIGLLRKSTNHTYSIAFKKNWFASELNLSLDYLTRGKSVSENSNQLVSPATFTSKPSISLDQFNVVAQHDHYVLDNFNIKLGGKWINSKQGGVHLTSFDPQLSAIWKRNEEQVFKFAYNTGTLRPDADQIQQGLDKNTEQQSMTSFDLIWHQQLSQQWTSTLTLYNQKLEDRIIQRVVNGEKSYGSIGDTKSKGFTFEVNGIMGEQTIWANISYTDAQYSGNAPQGLEPDSLRFDDSGRALAFPEWTANLGIDFSYLDIMIAPAIRYKSLTTNRVLSAIDSESGFAEYQDLPSSFQVDLNMEYSLDDNTYLSFFVSNIFNENEFIPTSIFNGYTEQYGRFSKLELSYHF